MIRRTMLAVLTFAAIGGLGWAPQASAHCTVNLGWCGSGGHCTVNWGTCYGSCTINTGYCGTNGRCTINTSVCLNGLIICTGDICDIH